MATTTSPPGPLERLTDAVEARVRPAVEATRRPGAQPFVRATGVLSAAGVLALFAFGTVMLATMLRWGYVAAGVLILAGLPVVLDTLARRSRAVHVIAFTPVAVIVPVIGLLAADVLWSWAGLPRPSPAIGLAIAGIVVAGIAYAYLRWVGHRPPSRHGLWAVLAALAGLVLAGITGQDVPALKLVLTAAAAGGATFIYLHRAAGPRIKHPLWWALVLVGITVVTAPLLAEAIQGGRVSAILLIAGALIAAVAALNGFWLPHSTETQRHTRRAFGAAIVCLVVLPLVVLAFVQVTSSAPAAPDERPLPAAAAATAPPQAAVDHRPIVLFDSGERFRTPLDVEQMLSTGDVQLCPQGNGLLADCRAVNGPGDLRNGFGNLRFDTQQIADADIPTTIYAHEVADQLHPGWTDIDYWWYLPDNPANTAQGAMCGAGLVIPEITCFDHQSDWEGATVVVDEHNNPVGVHYAAHNHVINVPWATLQAALTTRALRPYTYGRDVANHPLVFVARGTHAAYPLPCDASTCNGDSAFEDNRHDGKHAWPEEPCSTAACVTEFPHAASGTGIASWNAFDGHWGSAVCIAKVYCARSSAPKAPGSQGRYRRPWCYDFETGTNLRSPHPITRVPAACK